MPDATWSDRSLYALMLTYHGASILHTVRLLHLVVASSHEAEAVASGKAGELVSYAREYLRAAGRLEGPTFVGSDNKANALVASAVGNPSRIKHAMRRYVKVLLHRKPLEGYPNLLLCLNKTEVTLGFLLDADKTFVVRPRSRARLSSLKFA